MVKLILELVFLGGLGVQVEGLIQRGFVWVEFCLVRVKFLIYGIQQGIWVAGVEIFNNLDEGLGGYFYFIYFSDRLRKFWGFGFFVCY